MIDGPMLSIDQFDDEAALGHSSSSVDLADNGYGAVGAERSVGERPSVTASITSCEPAL